MCVLALAVLTAGVQWESVGLQDQLVVGCEHGPPKVIVKDPFPFGARVVLVAMILLLAGEMPRVSG